jgi:hypothetical protein
MKMIVADTAGTGTLIDRDGNHHQLSAEEWAETDARDTVIGPAWVRYRESGETIEVAAGETYQPQVPENPDVIDVRSATDAAHEIAAAIDGIGTDEERIYRALELAPHGHSRSPWFDQLRFIFSQQTGRELEEALRDELSGSELERALGLLH